MSFSQEIVHTVNALWDVMSVEVLAGDRAVALAFILGATLATRPSLFSNIPRYHCDPKPSVTLNPQP
jgi:hypothetical protein